MELLRIFDECRAAGGGECALATVVETNGSTYRRAGARLLVRGDRRTWGAISGGCIESDIAERALAVIVRGEPAVVRFKPADDDLHPEIYRPAPPRQLPHERRLRERPPANRCSTRGGDSCHSAPWRGIPRLRNGCDASAWLRRVDETNADGDQRQP